MTHEEIDILWQKAMQESIKDGEVYIRYHFAKLVAEKALAQEKALQTLHNENERLGLYKNAYAEQEPVACDGDFPEGFDESLGIPAQALRQANAALCEVTNNRMWDVPALAERMLLFCRNTHPPQRTEQEPVNFEKLAALGWQAMECTICGGGAMGYPQRTESLIGCVNHDCNKCKPLTDEQIWKAIRPLITTDQLCKMLIDISMDEYRAIEAAHGIKENT